MENSFQTSFIPKKPIVGNPVSNGIRSSSVSLFTVISVVILIVVGVSAGGLFLYKNYLTSQEEVLSSSIIKARGNFDKDTITDLETFDKRSSAARTVLKNHIVLSPMFKLIGDLTIPQVQYTKFDHQTTDKGFTVRMSGIARDYRSVALQADVFNSAKGRSFKNVVFSNLTKDKTNYVLFDVTFDVDPSLLSYQNNIAVSPASTTTSSSSTTTTQQAPVTTQTQVQTPVTTAPATTPITQPSTKAPVTQTVKTGVTNNSNTVQ